MQQIVEESWDQDIKSDDDSLDEDRCNMTDTIAIKTDVDNLAMSIQKLDNGNNLQVEHEPLKQLFDAIERNDVSSVEKLLETNTKHEVLCLNCLCTMGFYCYYYYYTIIILCCFLLLLFLLLLLSYNTLNQILRHQTLISTDMIQLANIHLLYLHVGKTMLKF